MGEEGNNEEGAQKEKTYGIKHWGRAWPVTRAAGRPHHDDCHDCHRARCALARGAATRAHAPPRTPSQENFSAIDARDRMQQQTLGRTLSLQCCVL
eukprot:6191201-Pleurochrysis_carterae.AAC.1